MSGYRIAYPSYVDESLFGSTQAQQMSAHRGMGPNVQDPNTQVVMSGDFDRIKFAATSSGNEVSERQREKERLHQISQARLSKWPNTIEALRKKKEQVRKEKADAEEALRKEIDAEEAALQAEKRRLAIERANKMLYDETDRVKALHSRLMLSDVLQEREAQIDFKKIQVARDAERERIWHEKQKEMLRKMDEEEERRDEELRQQAMATQVVRQEQLRDMRGRHEAKVQQLKKEGELMKQKAAEDLRAERQAELERIAAEKDAHRESMMANEYLRQLKEEDKMREKMEEDKMRKFAAMKEANLLERRVREEEKFKLKQEARARMIDIQVARLADLQRENATRLEKQAVEVEQKSQAAQKEREDKKRRELVLTHTSRQQQLRWKQEKNANTRAEDRRYADSLKSLNEQLREEEAMAARDRFIRNRERDQYLIRQMQTKKVEKDVTKEMEVMEADQIKQWMQDDDAIFQQYASICKEEWRADDKNTKPIDLLLSKKPPL